MDYRKQFHSDIVIDMYCYRKYGHNEADEPSFTQPVLYQKIEHHTNSEVDAMLGMYELGVVRMLDFGQEWGVALSDKGWRSATPLPAAAI